jgi:hypothetical protein
MGLLGPAAASCAASFAPLPPAADISISFNTRFLQTFHLCILLEDYFKWWKIKKISKKNGPLVSLEEFVGTWRPLIEGDFASNIVEVVQRVLIRVRISCLELTVLPATVHSPRPHLIKHHRGEEVGSERRRSCCQLQHNFDPCLNVRKKDRGCFVSANYIPPLLRHLNAPAGTWLNK